jgi:hypothetical protein
MLQRGFQAAASSISLLLTVKKLLLLKQLIKMLMLLIIEKNSQNVRLVKNSLASEQQYIASHPNYSDNSSMTICFNINLRNNFYQCSIKNKQ